MAIPIIPSLLRDNLAALAADDQRLDDCLLYTSDAADE